MPDRSLQLDQVATSRIGNVIDIAPGPGVGARQHIERDGWVKRGLATLVLEVQRQLRFDVAPVAWSREPRSRGADAPAVDLQVFDVGVLDQRADAVACAAVLWREDQVGIGKLAGLVDAKAGLQEVGPTESDRLSVHRLDVGAGVRREADTRGQASRQRLAQLHPDRRFVVLGVVEVESDHHAAEVG